MQNQPEAIPVRILTDKRHWRVCLKNVSETSAALSNGGANGVGLGTTNADALKFHFFQFTTNIQGMAQHLNTYQAILGMFTMYEYDLLFEKFKITSSKIMPFLSTNRVFFL